MKVLVISHNSFSSTLNNGKTLEAIFSSFPKESLAQVFFSENESPDFKFCSQYYKITDYDVLLNSFAYNKSRGVQLHDQVEHVTDSKRPSSNLKKMIYSKLKRMSDSLILFRDLLWKLNGYKTKNFEKWLYDTNPDLIFFMAGNYSFSHDVAI